MATVSHRRIAQIRKWFTGRIPTVIAGLVFLVLWQAIATAIDNNWIFAYPEYTWRSLMERSDTVFIRIVETFALAVIFGVVLGLLIAEIFTLRQMAMPIVIFAYAVPHPVLAPVFIIWFIVMGNEIALLGFTGPSAYLLESVTAADAAQTFAIDGVTTFGAWVGFFPVFLSTITGMNALEERYEHLGTVLGATRWQMVRYFRF